MAIFSITTPLVGKNGSPVWYPFEHTASSVDEFHKMLVRDGSVVGTRYTVEYRTGRKLSDPRRIILTPAGIAQVMMGDDVR